jgi:tetraacyldisaccharide 4'-kinase
MALKERIWNSPLSNILLPLSYLYRFAGFLRKITATPYNATKPVICIGNAVAGGSGKTPVCLSIASLLQQNGIRPNMVYLGYKRLNNNDIFVDITKHAIADTGDEPLLAAKIAPTFVSSSRKKSVILADRYSADVLLMDDGMQNPNIIRDITFLVIDSNYGFGNNKILPAGPLRMTANVAINNADAIILLGKNKEYSHKSSLPIFHATITPIIPPEISEKPVVAFCGLGRNEKFFNGLIASDVNVIETISYPDHYIYQQKDLEHLQKYAANNMTLVTTRKDAMRLPENFATIIDVQVLWDNEGDLINFIKQKINKKKDNS